MKRQHKFRSLDPLSLYVHIPFCETKCTYCDFNTYSGLEILIPSYFESICKEINLWGNLLRKPKIKTVFFGGGTPSYVSYQFIEKILDSVRDSFDLDATAEITLEANPDDCKRPKLEAYKGLGITRISLGVQSLNDQLLRLLDRRHTADQAVNAYKTITDVGFDNVSIDLMYGLPDQSLDDWVKTLSATVGMTPRHLSLYCLTLEGGTPMERKIKAGNISDPDPDLAADMYSFAEEMLAERNYRHYEISNWAQSGFESLHNLNYWSNESYLGIGPGAHSYIENIRFWNLKSPRNYVKALKEGDSLDLRNVVSFEDALDKVPVVESKESIVGYLEMAETLMMSFRLDTGVESNKFAQRFGRSLESVYGETIDSLVLEGLLERRNGGFKLTRRGRTLGNEVFVRFFEAV